MSALQLKKIILVLSLSFFPIFSCVSYAEDFDKIRSNAITFIKKGEVNKGLKVSLIRI